MASTKAFNKKCLNLQDIFNECFIYGSIYWKMLYSNLVLTQEDQYFFAKIEISFILFYCFVNLIIIILATAYNNKKYVIFIYNLVILKFNKILSKSN